jgi:hypothetical protein
LRPKEADVIDERVLGCLEVQIGGGFRPPKATLIITQYRVVLAQRTKPLVEAHKAQFGGGGGLFSRGPKPPAFADRYLAMPPDAALAETPGNSMLVWQQLQMVQIQQVDTMGDEGEAPSHYLVIIFTGPGIKLELTTWPPYPPLPVVRDALRQGFGALVRG